MRFRHPLSSHIERVCGPIGRRRLDGLRWFWREGIFVQAAESFSADYIPLFALAAGATASNIGMLAAAANLLSVAGFLPGALIASRLRSRKAAVLATTYGPSRLMLPVLALLPFVVPAGPTLVFLIIAVNALRALGGSLGNAAWTSFVADLVPLESRGRFFSSRFIAIGIAALVASPLAGWIIRMVNGTSVHALPGYQVSLVSAFAVGLVSFAFFLRIPEPPGRAPMRGTARDLVGLLRRNPPFAWLVASSLVWGAALNMAGPFFNVFIVTDLGGSAASVGIIAGTFALTGLFGQVVFGRLTDRRGNRRVLVLTGLLIPVLPVLWAFARAPWHGCIFNLAAGFLWAGYTLASFNFLLEMSPPEDRESSFAIYQTAVAASAVIGPLLGGFLAGVAGYRLVFVISGVGRLAAAILFIALVPGNEKGAARRA